jgi:cation transport protein ChaC
MSDPTTSEMPAPDWVFGYGSLIWNPGFEFRSAHLARLHGYHRQFCIRSARYRGTTQDPGIVLGLAQGGSCTGMVFELEPGGRKAALHALFEREMPGGFYVPRMLPVYPLDPQARAGVGTSARPRLALAFVANTRSPAFVRLPEAEILRRLKECAGERGPNSEYALRTHDSLRARGVRCSVLQGFVQRLTLAGGSHRSAQS